MRRQHDVRRRMVITTDTPAGRLRVLVNPIQVVDGQTRYTPLLLLGERLTATSHPHGGRTR